MKILIIEDDEFFQKFYSSKLKDAGFEVEAGRDGNEGLAKIKDFKPNLILLDLIMPNKDGFEVLSTMSQTPTYKNIPVLVFSTLGQEEDVKKALSLGAKDFINKSFFDFESLQEKITSLLSQA